MVACHPVLSGMEGCRKLSREYFPREAIHISEMILSVLGALGSIASIVSLVLYLHDKKK